MAATVFESADGTQYKLVSARALALTPIWNGNRLLDEEHTKRIKESIGNDVNKLNLNPFRIALIKQDDGSYSRVIVDGQHRASILKEYFSNPLVDDFTVMIGGKKFDSEDEVIEYFKVLNNTKSISWKEDPVICANRYVNALMLHFNIDKKKHYIRSGKTMRPFMSVDKLREAILAKRVLDWKETPLEFVENAVQKNENLLNELKKKDAYSLRDMECRAIEYKFAIGLDERFSWI